MTRVHSFTDDALGDLDAVGLADAIQSRALSASEAIEAAIARIERVDPDLNAMAERRWEAARSDVAELRGGFFAGVPTLVKDNCDLAGARTQQGSDAYLGRAKESDGDLARMFKATGLVPLGKSQLSEWGFSGSAEHPRIGPVRNPWNPEHTSGASSAGAGALVAAGALPIAHANDGGGSIRIPASACGLVGLKPTRGRLAQDKLMRQMPVRIISDGVLTRSVRDTAAFFREAERVYRDLKLAPIGDITRPGRKRLKVAFTTQSVGRNASPEVDTLTRETAGLLESLGHHVEEIEPPVPDYFADDFLLYWSLLALFVVRTGRREYGRSWDPAKLENITTGLARHCSRRMHRLPLAITRLSASRHISARFHKQYDVVLTPVVAHETPKVGHLDADQPFEALIEKMMDWVAFTPLQNATGDPAMSLPVATTASGLPQGMMFGAGRGREATLLELAYELEEARPFAQIHQG